MIKLTAENTTKAIERCRQLKPTVRFDVKDGEKFGQSECKASEKGLICYHIIGAATANIYRQSLKLQMA